MAWTLVNSSDVQVAVGSATPSLTISSTTNGNLVIVEVAAPTRNCTAVKDSNNVSFTAAVGGSTQRSVWYSVASSGATSVTATLNVSDTPHMGCMEFSGNAATSLVVSTKGNTGNSANLNISSSWTPTSGNLITNAGGYAGTTETWSGNANYTLPAGYSTLVGSGMSTYRVSTGTDQNGVTEMSMLASHSWELNAVEWKVAAAAGGGPDDWPLFQSRGFRNFRV